MREEAKPLFNRVAAKRLRFDRLKTTVIALRDYRGKPSPSSSTEISELDLNIELIP